MFYRIQDAQYAPETLLLPENQTSLSYATDTMRNGVSVYRSIEELAAYFCQAGVPMDPHTSILIELDGEYSEDEGEDAQLGEYLVYPTRIISAGPIPDEFFDAIEAFFEES